MCPEPPKVKVVFQLLQNLYQILVHMKDSVPVEEHKRVVYSTHCVEYSSVYISQTVSEHCHALKNGGVQASALAEHVFKTEYAVNHSRSI